MVASVFLVTALSLAWIGVVLGPESRSGMDGLALVLFTVVPIRPFSWVMAVIFAVLGVRVVRRAIRDAPSLVISSDGLTLPRGDVAPWSAVRSASLDAQGNVVIELAASNSVRDEKRWFERMRRPRRIGEGESVTLSSFDLGTDPAAVAEDLSRRLAEVRPPGGEV